MIVKNSGNHIISTLQHILPIIDTYTILDTGSTDNTISNIKNTLKGVDGSIFTEPFVDFSTSRNRSLDLSKGNCKYQIILDDTYQVNGINNLKKLLTRLDKPGFALRIKDGKSKNEYFSYRIIRTKDNIRYKYKVHELLDFGDKEIYTINDDHIFIYDEVSDYMETRTNSRILSDIKLLKEDLDIYKNDTRILCYLGILYHKLFKYDTSLSYLNKVIKNNDNKEWSHIAYSIIYSIYRIKNKPIENLLKNFLLISNDRADPYYYLAHYYFNNQRYEEACKLLKMAVKIKIPNSLFPVNLEIYNNEVWILLIECLYKLNHFSEVSKLLKLNHSRLRNNFRFINILSTLTNNKPESSLTLEKKIVVFCSKSFIKDWSPDHITKECSGSELILSSLAKSLVNHYRVFIFGNVIEGCYDGVEYYNYNKLLEFCNKYVIDYYISLRRVVDILYLPNIKNVYLWVQDTNISQEMYFQYHTQKFRKVLCLSDWHTNIIKNTYDIPNNYLNKTFNCINYDYFQKDIPKQPFRFIYSSHPSRGLVYLLKMMPKIKKLYPQTTLYIFSNKLDTYLQDIVDTLDYVIVSPRLNREKICEEYLKSDVWLYPTHFHETFCITAIEAQAAGCLCATIDIGSLGEVVGNRGVVVSGDIKEESIRDKLITKLDFVMKNKIIKERMIEKGKEYSKRFTIDKLSESWRKKYLN